jgi:hypothetical protein
MSTFTAAARKPAPASGRQAAKQIARRRKGMTSLFRMADRVVKTAPLSMPRTLSQAAMAPPLGCCGHQPRRSKERPMSLNRKQRTPLSRKSVDMTADEAYPLRKRLVRPLGRTFVRAVRKNLKSKQLGTQEDRQWQ